MDPVGLEQFRLVAYAFEQERQPRRAVALRQLGERALVGPGVLLAGSPRRPSFAPSSRMTIAGLSRASTLPMRARPPAVVSPEMLAFTTL